MTLNTKLAAIICVTVIAIGAVATYVAIENNHNSSDSPTESGKGGFYSWNPTVVTVNDGYSNLTPAFMTITETVFEAVYGKIPDYSGISLSDIPEQYRYRYSDYVLSETPGSTTVLSYDNTSKGTSEAFAKITVPFTPTKILCYSDTYIDTIYMILCDYYGEKAHSGNSPKAEAKLWDLVPAVSADIKNSLGTKFGLTVPDHVETLGTSKDNLTDYCQNNIDPSDKVVIFMSEYNIRSTNSSSWWSVNQNIEKNNDNIRFVYLLSNSPSMVLSTMEMIGKIIGYDNTDRMMTSVLAEIYVMQKAIEDSGKKITFYCENASKKSVGSDTLMGGILTDILGLTNVYDGSLMGSVLSDEKIAYSQPNLFVFYQSDSRTLDEQMRVA